MLAGQAVTVLRESSCHEGCDVPLQRLGRRGPGAARAAIDGRPWNAAGLDGWIRGDRVVVYYRDAASTALFRPTFIGRFRERDGKTVRWTALRHDVFAWALLPIWLAPGIVCLVSALLPPPSCSHSPRASGSPSRCWAVCSL